MSRDEHITFVKVAKFCGSLKLGAKKILDADTSLPFSVILKMLR